MIRFFKNLLFVGLVEKIYDFKVYFRYRYKRKYKYDKIVKFYKPYKLNYDKNIIIVIYCGIGDFLYGIPAFNEIKKKLQTNNKKFIIYVGNADNNFNNSNLIHIAEQTNIFDEAHSFHAPNPIYWKCLDLSDIQYDENATDIYHFVYDTCGYGNKTRIERIFKQFSLKYSKQDLQNSITTNDNADDKSQTFIGKKHEKPVFLHLDTRSGEYIYPYALKLIYYLLKDGFEVILFTKIDDIIKQQQQQKKDYLRIKHKNTIIRKKLKEIKENQIIYNKIIKHKLFINVQAKNINQTLKMLKDIDPYVIAVNSIFWPLTNITNTKTLALHYINSNDGYHFFHNKMQFITANKYSYKKIKKINKNKCLWVNGDNYDKDENGYINYHPEYIVFLFKKLVADNEPK
ncbi:MAG: hypothetical protein DRQ51_09255 [Gammaproteobacteria bacterium]|nr:MAG: hypothetical protein DRQ51_09255 [Gammaproteobacteria bacterium]